ncbi:hypothetical protein KAU11_12045 [Candidatus Babeliales bacterium]|nr:hypothetical protein [Candidatus Babeliales bacterium]
MSKIKNSVNKNSVSWVEMPGIEGFEVQLRFLTREDLMKIRNSSLSFKFSKKTHQREEEVDNDKFLENYADKAIADWRGLKIKHLAELFPADISGQDPDDIIEYNSEEALNLLKHSTIFDTFITEMMGDFEQFSIVKAEIQAKN